MTQEQIQKLKTKGYDNPEKIKEIFARFNNDIQKLMEFIQNK